MGLVTSTPDERARIDRVTKGERNESARVRRLLRKVEGLERRLATEHAARGALLANLHTLFGPGVAPPAGVDQEAWDSIRRALLADA